jgi:hypothetical protein
MKYATYIALIGCASSLKIQKQPECSYHKSEDGLTCDKVVASCIASTPVPIMEKCPDREEASGRAPAAPKVEVVVPKGETLAQLNPVCEW